MPTVKGNQFIERIYNGKDLIRRVYKDKELVYGLYDINYHSLGSSYIPINDIRRYAWGKTRYIAPTDNNNDFDDYFDQYKTHWFGWYDDQNLSIERIKINNRYAVTTDEKRDLDLYAKWKQKKFSYSYYVPTSTTSPTPAGGEEISNQGEAFVAEVNSHIGETSSDISSYDGQPWGAHGDWCARYVSACLKAVGYTSGILTTYAPDFFNIANLTPSKFSAQTFVSSGVNSLYGNKYPSNFVISESALQPGDILSSFNLYWDGGSLSNPKGWFSGYDGKKCHGLHVVVCVGHDSNGKALVVGGNERGGTSTSAVRGPHVINFTSGSSGHSLRDYWVVARPNWMPDYDAGDAGGGESSIITSGSTITGDCADQNNPSLPGDIPSGDSGELPELPSKGTYCDDLPENWYVENGGWYWWGKGIRGQCVWGANGRTAQMRGSATVGAPWGDGEKDYSGGSVGGNANTWMTDCKGHWSSTTDWTQAQVGDCIIYEWIPTYGSHVVVIEEVLGNGSFMVSSWNHSGPGHDHECFGGVKKETAVTGEPSTAGFRSRKILGYVINHIDPVIGGSWDPNIKYITNEREYNYEISNWDEWKVVDESSDNWDFDWEGEF